MGFLNKISIITKIVAISAILAAIFLGTSFGYAVINTRNDLKDSATNLLVHESSDEVDKLNSTTEEIQATVVALSQTPPVQGIIRARENSGIDRQETSTITQWKKRLAAIFTAEMSATHYYDQLRYLDEDGNELVRVNNINGTPEVVSEDKLQNKANRGYFIESMKVKPGGIYISKADLNREGDPPQISIPYKPVIRYAVPIFDENTGQRKGILIANILINKEMVLQEGPYSTNKSYIINSEGFYIKHPDSSKEWGGPIDLNTGDNFYKEFPNIKAENFSEEAGSFEEKNNIFVFSKANINPNDKNQQWIIIRSVPTDVLFANTNKIAINAMIIGFSTFAILFFVYLFLINYLLSPLKQLTNAAIKIGQGSFEQKVEVTSQDEVGRLASAFNTMADQLKKSYLNLEEKVKQRTSELERSNNLMIGREVKMSELKKEIESLKQTQNGSQRSK